MPLTTKEFDLEEEIESLEEEMVDHADEHAEKSFGSDAAAQMASMGQQTARFRDGIAWQKEEWGDVESITLSALTNGERHRVRDIADETGWKRTDCYVAAGTYEAPYLEHNPEEVTEDEYRETILNVIDLHPAFVDWAESKISELGRPSGDMGKSYRRLVLERRNQQTSPNENG